MSASQRPASSTARLNKAASDLLAALREEYDLADGFAKEVQSFVDEAGIPAINELRYAGYHLLYALSDGGEPPDSQLRKAINHCRRASYEAAEAGLLTALDRVKLFQDDYRTIVISEVLPNWTEILTQAEACKAVLVQSRQKGEKRHEDYSLLMSKFRELVQHCSILASSRDELNKKIVQARRHGRQFVVTITIACVTLLATVTFGLWALLEPRMTQPDGEPAMSAPAQISPDPAPAPTPATE